MRRILCDICGSDSHELVYKNESAPPPASQSTGSVYRISEGELQKPRMVVRCRRCRFIFVLPELSQEQITSDYVGMADEEYLSEEAGRRKQARIILERLSRVKRGRRLLDVGCGPGFLLDEARKMGWEVQGVDLSVWARDHARQHFGIEVFQGTLKEARFPTQSFDAVVMTDVIEHVSSPRALLEEAWRILRNDGVLYISTPDIGSFLSRFLQARWWGIQKYHLVYFMRQTLEKLLDRTGFKPMRYSAYPRVFSLGYWLRRLKGYPAWARFPFELWMRLGGGAQRLVRVELHDQIDLIARKIRTLEAYQDAPMPYFTPTKEKPKVIAVLPAYNAQKTLAITVRDIPRGTVDEIILVDDASRDQTVSIARELGLTVFVHEENRGYGANQKTCYREALKAGADIVVMVHPDYQYDPKIIPELVEPLRQGRADAVFGSRMMKGGALEGGMPPWKHNANILLTAFENVVLGTYLTEYHSGFRAYSANLLKRLPLERNSDDFVFDTEIIVQILCQFFRIEEVPIKTRYFEEASSISFVRSVQYGMGILVTLLKYCLHVRGWYRFRQFERRDDEAVG